MRGRRRTGHGASLRAGDRDPPARRAADRGAVRLRRSRPGRAPRRGVAPSERPVRRPSVALIGDCFAGSLMPALDDGFAGAGSRCCPISGIPAHRSWAHRSSEAAAWAPGFVKDCRDYVAPQPPRSRPIATIGTVVISNNYDWYLNRVSTDQWRADPDRRRRAPRPARRMPTRFATRSWRRSGAWPRPARPSIFVGASPTGHIEEGARARLRARMKSIASRPTPRSPWTTSAATRPAALARVAPRRLGGALRLCRHASPLRRVERAGRRALPDGCRRRAADHRRQPSDGGPVARQIAADILEAIPGRPEGRGRREPGLTAMTSSIRNGPGRPLAATEEVGKAFHRLRARRLDAETAGDPHPVDRGIGEARRDRARMRPGLAPTLAISVSRIAYLRLERMTVVTSSRSRACVHRACTV